MMRGMFAAISGLRAHQIMLDTTANDLANVNTLGYKSARTTFRDSLSQIQRGGSGTSGTQGGTNAAQVGLGVQLGSIDNLMGTGAIQSTGNVLDVAIQGPGFFQVQLPDGGTAYTRDGSFQINSQGQLVTSSGYQVQPAITIPAGTQSITIAKDGTISAAQSGSTALVQLGSLQLANFINPAGLQAHGENLYLETAASGTASNGTPGSNGLGQLNQGYAETSTVTVVEELVNLIQTQRAYELNSRAISTSDNMLGKLTSL